ncbi:MAG TPA: CHRD domain-containing protein [Vicinamibacterales bacterium]|nr:CHRD domain-containing protein [Vicinamibacterales bacterium]
MTGILWLWVPAGAQTVQKFKGRLSPVPIDGSMQSIIAGSGSMSAELAGSKLTISGTFEGLRSPATVARLHRGPDAGIKGPALADLTVSRATSGTVGGAVELTSTQVEALKRHQLYVQIHSEKAPDGNLWGWFFEEGHRQ